METDNVEAASELFKAQVHIYKHAFAYANSMALNCAIQLGIPDIVHNHKKPITLPELVSALKLPSSKSIGIHRLMCLLVHSGFFATAKIDENSETDGYILTTPSRLLLKTEFPNLSPCVRVMIDPIVVTPWQLMLEWFHNKNEEATAFETAHGVPMWEFCAQNPRFDKDFNEGTASDSQMMRLVVKDCKEVFEGMNSLVDVGGGIGIIAKTILEVFPHLKCTVLDLPYVVANMPQSENLSYVGGDMFQSIPHADAILFKNILHSWSDEDCVKVLKKCREAIAENFEEGRKGKKVLIIDIVLDTNEDEPDMTQVKLMKDMLMVMFFTGKERTEKEWEKLFLKAGFTRYNIRPIFGLRSLIEVFP
ncbi:trans-resveratrol di-O-methyltransferase-like [Nicotiana tabacum]|uniref:Myricetin 7/4'-O-methyltransferase 2 n=1 Tax=Nicotiana tabacum TaxID=4097 RepID=A0A1S4CV50_TOBAC|nr:PREDICTED: trans-resveratrol di-O-methyltransferase-like [Nicotiana tabacum]